MTDAAKEQPKKQLFDPRRFQLSEYVYRNHTLTVEQGTTLDDVLDKAFFANFASQLSPYDEITVRVDDGTFYARLLVTSCGRTWAVCKPIFHLKLTTADVDMTQAEAFDGYEVRFRGPACKWSVIRKQDNKLLVEKLDDKLAAETWLSNHVKAV